MVVILATVPRSRLICAMILQTAWGDRAWEAVKCVLLQTEAVGAKQFY
ncbi:MAG: hypothetical protein GDA56_18685 [Hormoscilla sp. GM7CHS1pb]|nr:hypothetical protein [Hormoscilla sp. GM7CHS1pb]